MPRRVLLAVELRPTDQAITDVRVESPQLPLDEVLFAAIRRAELPLEGDALEQLLTALGRRAPYALAACVTLHAVVRVLYARGLQLTPSRARADS
jgi:hypothetical protein